MLSELTIRPNITKNTLIASVYRNNKEYIRVNETEYYFTLWWYTHSSSLMWEIFDSTNGIYYKIRLFDVDDIYIYYADT